MRQGASIAQCVGWRRKLGLTAFKAVTPEVIQQMTVSVDSILCGNCGAAVEEPPGLPTSERTPCLSCGSTLRRFAVHAFATVRARLKLGLKTPKRLKHKKPAYEAIYGEDFHRDTGRWNLLARVIDRAKNRYHKVIQNPENGQIIHYCDEPLSDHTGHGSDKLTSRAGSRADPG